MNTQSASRPGKYKVSHYIFPVVSMTLSDTAAAASCSRFPSLFVCLPAVGSPGWEHRK